MEYGAESLVRVEIVADVIIVGITLIEDILHNSIIGFIEGPASPLLQLRDIHPILGSMEKTKLLC